MKNKLIIVLSVCLTACGQQAAEPVQVQMNVATATGEGEYVGTVMISETAQGLLFTPDLQHLSPGLHGFHLHENPSCLPAEKDGVMTPALAAGGHFDPQKTGTHEGPEGNGHLGDLPALYVDNTGHANTAVLAPRLLSLKEIKHTALMIHVGADNYSDKPEVLGGGGARMVCGVV